jgi:hypothetical protein
MSGFNEKWMEFTDAAESYKEACEKMDAAREELDEGAGEAAEAAKKINAVIRWATGVQKVLSDIADLSEAQESGDPDDYKYEDGSEYEGIDEPDEESE